MTSIDPTRPSAGTVVALHAHPDDEAIFTGITLRRLADAGHRVVLVTATGGDEGEPLIPLPGGQSLADRRLAELEAAAAELGVARLVVLGHRDSGMAGSAANAHPGAFAGIDLPTAARSLADLLIVEGAATVLHDDPNGIYGHPDHVTAHRLAVAAADLTGASRYETTVDREHLHFVDPHLVRHACEPHGHGRIGRTTAEITLAVAGTADEIAAKRRAMAAHASQITAAHLDAPGFADTYGLEWFMHAAGNPTLRHLDNAHPWALSARADRPGALARR